MSEVRRFSVLYGSSPAHLLLGLATLAVSVWAVIEAFGRGPPLSLTKWFVGSSLAHDLVLLPLYSLMLVGLLRVVGGRGAPGRSSPSVRRMLVLNHLRVPAALSLLMLLVFFPFILGLAGGYQGVSGLSTDPFLPRWLLLSAGLFLLSGVLLVVQLARGRTSAATERSDSTASGAGSPPAGRPPRRARDESLNATLPGPLDYRKARFPHASGSPAELVARGDAVLRRAAASPSREARLRRARDRPRRAARRRRQRGPSLTAPSSSARTLTPGPPRPAGSFSGATEGDRA